MIIVQDRMRRLAAVSAVLALALLACAPLHAARHQIPTPRNADTYPSYDAHPAEHVVIAAVPYITKKQSKVFRVHYYKNGFLPIYLVVTNNGNTPLSLSQARIDLIADGERIEAAQPIDVETRMLHIRRPGTPSLLPAPLPYILRNRPTTKDKEIQADFNELEYDAITVPPHSTRAGFLFYDINGLGNNVLAGAKLTLRDLQNADGKELFFFEIPLDKYL